MIEHLFLLWTEDNYKQNYIYNDRNDSDNGPDNAEYLYVNILIANPQSVAVMQQPLHTEAEDIPRQWSYIIFVPTFVEKVFGNHCKWKNKE